MFICHSCGMPSQPCRRAHHVALETRAKKYGYRAGANRVKRPGCPAEWKDDPGGVGHETVREVLLCGPCAGVEEQRFTRLRDTMTQLPSEIETAVQTLTA